MRLDTHMTQRMDQKMILAPRMIQSMEILQLPIMALQERIQQELEENPGLELQEATDEEPSADGQPATELDESTAENSVATAEEPSSADLEFDRLEAFTRDWEDH